MKNRTLAYINPLHVDFGNRFRSDYGDLLELAEDIKQRGVITPISVADKSKLSAEVLTAIGASDESQQYILLAGGRRTKAALYAKSTEIPAQIYDHIPNELEMRLIELHENTLRQDLSYAEEVDLKRRVFELATSIYGEKRSTSPDAPGVSIRSVAEDLGVSPAGLSQDIKLAKAIEEFPELAEMESKKAAQKEYERRRKLVAMRIMQERAAAKHAASPEEIQRKKIADGYKVGNFFDAVAGVEDGVVHLVEIDPPYSINLRQIKRGTRDKTDAYNEVAPELYPDFMKRVFNQSYRVMAPHSWMICWFGPEPWFQPIYEWIIEAGKPEDVSLDDWIKSGEGFQLRRIPAVWTKRSGQVNAPDRYLATATEFFFYARKGQPGMNKPGMTNVFEYAPVPPGDKVHPTARPIEMIQDMLEIFVRPGRTVMVPFAGSGNTLLAAANLNLTAFGWDLAEDYKTAFDVRVMTGPLRKWKSY